MITITGTNGAAGTTGADGGVTGGNGGPGGGGQDKTTTVTMADFDFSNTGEAVFGDTHATVTQTGGMGGAGGAGGHGTQAGGGGGMGGDGGDSTLTLNNVSPPSNLNHRFNSNGGDGGTGGAGGTGGTVNGVGGNGGAGGDAVLNIIGGDAAVSGVRFIEFRALGGNGGHGGSGSASGNGGNGGNATVDVENMQIASSAPMFATGGNGGNGTVGGDGGDASIVVRNNLISTSVIAFLFQTGQGGTGSGGTNGADGVASLDFSGNTISGSPNSTLVIRGSDASDVTFSSSYAIQVDLSTQHLKIGDGMNTLVGVENVDLSGTGTAGHPDPFLFFHSATMIGDGLANSLSGTQGGDYIDGGGGADKLNGGGGNDTYMADSSDTITEKANGGTDTVLTSSTVFTLAPNVENLTLLDGGVTGYGNGLANVLAGNGADNALWGWGGNDIIYGMAGNDKIDGGTGADDMTGGTGDDTYVVDNALDVIHENAGEGIDTVMTDVNNYVLADTLENLILLGTAAKGTGNAGNNAISGNGGNNTLLGGKGDDTLHGGEGNDYLDGGTGADRLVGGTGDDTYVYGAGDFIVEKDGGGTDTVLSTLAYYHLGATLENVTLISDALNADGNNLANIMIGNAHDNVLLGGRGNDTLSGGDGNDTLWGGENADTMTGGNGSDTFVFATVFDSTTAAMDHITDMSQAQDRLDLSRIDADVDTDGDQAFHLVSHFTFNAGELVLNYNIGTDETTMLLDLNGDGAADFALLMNGHITSTSGWLL